MPAKTDPKFVMEEFFDGSLEGWGIQQSRLGQAHSKFTIKAKGIWDEKANQLALQETYRFDDGLIDRLTWQIRKLPRNVYRGTEDRVEGEAEGTAKEGYFRWHYSRNVAAKDGSETTYEFEDSFYRINERSVVVKVSIRKLHFEIATMSVFYRKIRRR